jgi:hypothetical protein
MSPRTESIIAIVAAIFVLFTAMLEPRVAAALAVALLAAVGIGKIWPYAGDPARTNAVLMKIPVQTSWSGSVYQRFARSATTSILGLSSLKRWPVKHFVIGEDPRSRISLLPAPDQSVPVNAGSSRQIEGLGSDVDAECHLETP